MMGVILVSNISSWVLVTLILFLVHQYRSKGEPYGLPISLGYTILALSLLVNTVLRTIDESYQSVIAGSVITKISFIFIIVMLLLKEYKLKKELPDGQKTNPD